jgi:hypothetical protein
MPVEADLQIGVLLPGAHSTTNATMSDLRWWIIEGPRVSIYGDVEFRSVHHTHILNMADSVSGMSQASRALRRMTMGWSSLMPGC